MIEATRTRLGVSPEWLTLSLLCFGALIVAMLAVRELRVVPQTFASVSAGSNAATDAGGVPPDAMSVSTLVVGAHELRVGDPAAEAIARLAASATLVATSDERGAIGVRQVRTYQLDGSSVTVVLEAFARRGPLRVAAIYLR